ncbi:hypothetical protein [Azospirillum sp. ST 5-10]|uniref:hypothetical protein n=1 Tax=unclassified Azospirillum TaxID=2630922 RepID=UPI003F4A088A
MNEPARRTHDAACRDALAHMGDRLERLRRSVERLEPAGRAELERVLDALRGRRNRAMARVEAARQASPEAWPFTRAGADQAIGDLAGALEELEARVSRAAA